MKKHIVLMLAMLIATVSIAQNGINYKAIVKDDAGNILANEQIDIQFSIQTTAEIIYAETHSPTTDNNGLVILNIGEGTPIGGDFTDVDWASDDHFLNVQINIGAGLIDLGTTQFMAIPYAKHANTATTALNAATKINDLSDGKSDTNGSSIFLGIEAGANNDDGAGNWNIGIGYQALRSNTTGNLNTASGFQALSSNITGNYNTANGFRVLYSNTTGSYNTANGSTALALNTTGGFNTANGYDALYSNTTGVSNTANGFGALFNNTTGGSNTANGAEALYSNTTGHSNVANGFRALYSNTTGLGNIANGYNALISNTTGDYNTANGAEALYSNTTGHSNVANGFRALYSNTTGLGNIANGNFALYYNTEGHNNTANGRYALYSNTTGSGNVALGNLAGYFEAGSNTLYIANSTTNTPLIYGEFDNKILQINGSATANSSVNANPDIILGGTADTGAGDDGIISSDSDFEGSDIFLRSYDAVVVQLDYDNNETGQFEIKAGDGTEVFEVRESGNATLSGSLTQNSDRRLKKDIETLPYGLNEVLQLQPKAYNWKNREEAHKSLGLIAQEVQPIIKEVVNTSDDEMKTLGISYSELIPVLINAIKEQQATINKQAVQNQEQQSTLSAMLERIEKLEAINNQ